MGKKDDRIDAYISAAAPFAQPVLAHLRSLVHQACPQVEESMKWSMPHFDYKGDILCSMAAFKKHCAFGFRKAALMKDPHQLLQLVGKTAMGSFGQINALEDLPPDDIIISYIEEAARLNEVGLKVPAGKKAPKKELPVPEALQKELNKHPRANKTFTDFSPSHRREYIEWISEAKTDATREKRISTAITWMEEGKSRNWKYEKRQP